MYYYQMDKHVSIPYRYTKNTPHFYIDRQTFAEFQSPIGTQKTQPENTTHGFFVVFQSPIGTQKTLTKHSFSFCSLFVSIPYRYTKNSPFNPPMPEQYKVSIPYRYTKNNSCKKTLTLLKIVSIPYRYTKN